MGTLNRLKQFFRREREPAKIVETDGYRGVERRTGQRAVSLGGIRVLVVDDSKTIVAVLKKMLVQNQFEVLTAMDGKEAIEVATQHQPHLVFLDIVMPGMNGFAALRKLRRGEGTSHIPVIMMSGNEQATEEFYVQRIGADDFMKKPFSRAEVFVRIERLLDNERLSLPTNL